MTTPFASLTGRIRDRNIWLVYGVSVLVGVAYGISISLTALQLNTVGFGKQSMGTLAACFASGIVLFSLPSGAFIKRFSAKRTLVFSIAGYAVCVSIFPFLTTFAEIASVRFFDGAFAVGTWVSFETILLSRSDKDKKAFVTSLYAVAIAIGYILGPFVAKGIVAIAPMRVAFLVSGALALAASALVVTRLDRDVSFAHDDGSAPSTRTRSWELVARIKTSCFATLAYGWFQSSVVLFLPLFLIEKKGVSESQTILIPAFFAAGMLLFSSYAGRLGDKYGHLLVMRVLGAVGTVMVAGFVWLDSWPLMCAAIFVAGATLAAISPVSLALQGVIVDAREYARANAIYNAFYAAGMLLGPPVSSYFFAHFGGGAMLWHLAALWAGFVVFSSVFWRDDPAARRVRADASAAATTSAVASPPA